MGVCVCIQCPKNLYFIGFFHYFSSDGEHLWIFYFILFGYQRRVEDTRHFW